MQQEASAFSSTSSIMLSFIDASQTVWNISANFIEEVLKIETLLKFHIRHLDKKLQRENLAPWISVTGDFSFQNRTGCVCLNAIGNRRWCWWCLVIDMNGHLCSFSLYGACCKAWLSPWSRDAWGGTSWRERKRGNGWMKREFTLKRDQSAVVCYWHKLVNRRLCLDTDT